MIIAYHPTPHDITTASLTSLIKERVYCHPSDAKLAQLQQLASQTIGTKDVARQRCLVLEQKQVIKELKLLQEHIEELDAEICAIVQNSREGKILFSLGIIGPIQAAMMIAAIGNILNFPSAATLKSYFGWAPKREQTGTSYDRSSLSHAGTRTMKQILFLIFINAIRLDNEWARKYERLVPIKCGYDENTRSHKGKLKVIGCIAGQIIEMIYALLKKDAETLSKVLPGETPPEPMLYDREIHQAHKQGKYRSLKPAQHQETIVLLPKQSS